LPRSRHRRRWSSATAAHILRIGVASHRRDALANPRAGRAIGDQGRRGWRPRYGGALGGGGGIGPHRPATIGAVAIGPGARSGIGGGGGGGVAGGGGRGGGAARSGSTTVSRSGALTAPMPATVGRGSAAACPRGGVIWPESLRCTRACSATTKNDARSGMSPRRFQVLPLREIIDSRDTLPAMIHCCSVASSRQVRVSPLSSRMIHCRSSPAVTGPEPVGARGSGTPWRAVGGGWLGPGARVVGIPLWVAARLRILNMCPHVVHLTVTPPGFSRASSSSYSVWHFSQRTSIAGLGSASFVTRRRRQFYGSGSAVAAHRPRPRS
jgi:hypothetical protein